MKLHKLKTNSAMEGTSNELVQLVKRPYFFSTEKKAEKRTLDQEIKHFLSRRCTRCTCNNDLMEGSPYWCWKCKDTAAELIQRLTYVEDGGAFDWPNSPLNVQRRNKPQRYTVGINDVARVDENGNIVQLPGGQPFSALVKSAVAERIDNADAEARKAAEEEKKKAAKSTSDVPAAEKPNKVPAKKEEKPAKLEPPTVTYMRDVDPFDGIDAGSKKKAYESQQLSVDDYDELNDAPIPEFLK